MKAVYETPKGAISPADLKRMRVFKPFKRAEPMPFGMLVDLRSLIRIGQGLLRGETVTSLAKETGIDRRTILRFRLKAGLPGGKRGGARKGAGDTTERRTKRANTSRVSGEVGQILAESALQ